MSVARRTRISFHYIVPPVVTGDKRQLVCCCCLCPNLVSACFRYPRLNPYTVMRIRNNSLRMTVPLLWVFFHFCFGYFFIFLNSILVFVEWTARHFMVNLNAWRAYKTHFNMNLTVSSPRPWNRFHFTLSNQIDDRKLCVCACLWL